MFSFDFGLQLMKHQDLVSDSIRKHENKDEAFRNVT